ncbi:MAG: pirin family protein [bacterium]
MNMFKTLEDAAQTTRKRDGLLISEPLCGAELTVGSGFTAKSFNARDIGATMDPLVMVDHYVMTQPTFGAHPHAGMSAVTLLFADSEGLFHNRDSLDNDFDLHPGDLYWLSAGRGAVHDEYPQDNARTHGLQVFVNVPQAQRFNAPASRLVRSADMPVINTADYRVKVALGYSNGVPGAVSPSAPMTILDGTIQPRGRFSHEAGANQGIWVQSIAAGIDVKVAATTRHLAPGQAVAVKTDIKADIRISNTSDETAHFVLFAGEQIGETYVQDGPFVMGTQKQIEDIRAVYDKISLAGN